jgi:hypothetical protein
VCFLKNVSQGLGTRIVVVCFETAIAFTLYGEFAAVGTIVLLRVK